MISALVVGSLSTAAAVQALAQRVDQAPDGEVRFSYAARPGAHRNDWRTACDSGPVRVSLTKRGHEITHLRVSVGQAITPGPNVTDLGTVGTRDAARYLLDLARTGAPGAGEHAVVAATLADSVTLWPELLRIARDDAVPRRTRRSAVFWVGQAAEEAATRGLAELVGDAVDREVKEHAVFALAQRPRHEGVPALIGIARSHRDPAVRRKAIFWLGQSDDPRALALFEEILKDSR